MNPWSGHAGIHIQWSDDKTHLCTTAPSNIALIKYMGKTCHNTNQPLNASLSYTLDAYQSTVQLSAAEKDQWSPLDTHLNLTPKEQARCLSHVGRVRAWCGIQQPFLVQSTNNFAASCGLASSASSFAALTASVAAWAHQNAAMTEAVWQQWAQWSRWGSGSSCRSFYGPWALWQQDQVTTMDLPYTQLTHALVMIDGRAKSIGSSDAHRRITTSRYFPGRANRAKQRLDALLVAMRQTAWHTAYEIIAEEYQDMHQLFESADTPFVYRSTQTRRCEQWLRALWRSEGDGPWVTMDAGPNIHLLFRERDQAEITLAALKKTMPDVVIHPQHEPWSAA